MRPGACSPWVGGEQIEKLPAIVAAYAKLTTEDEAFASLAELCAESATAASDVLYEATGQVFTGNCGPVTIRPVSRPMDMDTRAWSNGLGGLGWTGAAGLGSSYGGALPGVVPHYGKENPPEVDLGVYPVTEIVKVKIDGIEIPAEEYELRNSRILVRVRPTVETVPVERYGWPTSQIPDLPDTQVGTFSVTYKYGQAPSAMGKLAAKELAKVLCLAGLGDFSHFPRRVTGVNRQGVSVSVADVVDLVTKGATGIYTVDLFVKSVNPNGNQRQALVMSPDLSRSRRLAKPTA
jgi:hypothetical protein